MKPRNREITIFNVSMLDVISGAVGAFLILMVVLFPSYQKVTGETDDEIEQENRELRAELQKWQNRKPLDAAAIEERRRQLEESTASVQREIARVEPMQNDSPGQGTLTLFTRWQLPVHSGGRLNGFNAFLVPIDDNEIADTMRKDDAIACAELRRWGELERARSGHLETAFGLTDTVVLHRAVSPAFAIYYCKWESTHPGVDRHLGVSGHLSYGNKVWPLPHLTVLDGGKLLGVARLLDDSRVEIIEADEARGTAEKRRQEFQAQRRRSIAQKEEQIRKLEDLKRQGKLDEGRAGLLEALKEIVSQQREADRGSNVKPGSTGEGKTARGKNP